MKHALLLSFLMLVLASCSDPQNNNMGQDKLLTNEGTKEDLALLGRKGTVHFQDMNVEVFYVSDSLLHWKTVDHKGTVAEGDEKLSYKRLSENLHFVNWIEKDGFTVSQVIDTKSGTVKAFWSFADKNSKRGGRSFQFTDGTFVFAK